MLADMPADLQPVPPPRPPSYGAVPGPGAPPRRTRPSGWWFAVGGVCVLAAIAAGIGLLVWTLGGLLDVEASVRADGEPHAVVLDGGGERMVWGRSADGTDCTIVDTATGEEVDYSPVSGTLTKEDRSGSWTGVVTFDPGSGSLQVTCVDTGGEVVQLGPASDAGTFVGKVLATVLVPLVLGGLGLVVLVVTGILFATGAPRAPRAPRAAR